MMDSEREATMKVKDVMSWQVVTIGPSDSCRDAVGRMHRARVRHLPVINRDGLLVGMVTDRDLRHHLFSPRVFKTLGQTSVEGLLKAAPVAEVMTRLVISVPADAELSDAAQLMRTERIGSLPVVDGKHVVGIVTETDLLRHICQADAGCSPECTEIIVSYP